MPLDKQLHFRKLEEERTAEDVKDTGTKEDINQARADFLCEALGLRLDRLEGLMCIKIVAGSNLKQLRAKQNPTYFQKLSTCFAVGNIFTAKVIAW